MTDVSIRAAHARELAQTAELLAACSLPTADLAGEALPHFIVAHVDGGDGLAGVVGLEPYGDVGLLRSLAVDPAHRGNGVARALVEALESHARGEGIATLFLLTTTAERYFERSGYAYVERTAVPAAIRATREFADLCPDSARVMRKELG